MTTSVSLQSLPQLLTTVLTHRGTPAPAEWSATFHHILLHPLPADEALFNLSREHQLTHFETLALSIAAHAESSPAFAEHIARLQSPTGRSRPLFGLIASLCAHLLPEPPRLIDLLSGPAARLGLLEFSPSTVALPERAVSVPLHLCAALEGVDVYPPEVTPLSAAIPLPPSITTRALRYATSLKDGVIPHLILRGLSEEPTSAAHTIASRLRLRPVLIPTTPPPALGPWLTMRRLLPVTRLDLAPGEVIDLAPIPGYTGPRLICATPQGSIHIDHAPALEWRLPLPSLEERRALWQSALPDSPCPERRYSASRIHHLASLMRQLHKVNAAPIDEALLLEASFLIERQSLGHLATPVQLDPEKLTLIIPPQLDLHLNRLLSRCRLRDTAATHLGPATQAAFRPGVRGLFSGPPGTGKSLAAAWLASRLHLPLFRIDLATISSKYIGETEKNLARLFDQAEQSEVILLFDEADSLFSRRTAVSDSNDRFANAQTNYLLERMESFSGIAILTTNHDANLDEAFERRLDFHIQFPAPSPSERRRLWHAHLGDTHDLDPTQINLLAAHLDWSGGHIRNAVLHAATTATGPINWTDILTALQYEATRLRTNLPFELRLPR